MIDWKAFYANGGYYGDNDPYCYDDGIDDEEYEEGDEYEPYEYEPYEKYDFESD